MKVVTDGILRGKTLELDKDTGLPDGLHVRVTLETEALDIEQKRLKALALCGAWSADESLGGVFEKIAAERHETVARPVNF